MEPYFLGSTNFSFGPGTQVSTMVDDLAHSLPGLCVGPPARGPGDNGCQSSGLGCAWSATQGLGTLASAVASSVEPVGVAAHRSSPKGFSLSATRSKSEGAVQQQNSGHLCLQTGRHEECLVASDSRELVSMGGEEPSVAGCHSRTGT